MQLESSYTSRIVVVGRRRKYSMQRDTARHHDKCECIACICYNWSNNRQILKFEEKYLSIAGRNIEKLTMRLKCLQKDEAIRLGRFKARCLQHTVNFLNSLTCQNIYVGFVFTI